jgi:hypothetical protein
MNCIVHIARTFAHGAFACGSMVLYRYCGSFFRPAGRKNDPQGMKHDQQAKVLIVHCTLRMTMCNVQYAIRNPNGGNEIE